jgi:signal transduction histidine kinase
MWQRWWTLAGAALVVFGVVASTLWSSSHWINQPFPGFFLYHNTAVSPDFLGRWSGRIAGLKSFDRIVGIDDAAVNRSEEVYDRVKKRPVGSTFRYSVEREQERLVIMVPSMRFSLFDWLLSFGIYLLVGTAFIAIGVVPLYVGSAAPAAFPLFLMTGGVFLWFGTTFDFVTDRLFPKEARILAFVLTPSAGIHLGLTLTRESLDRRSRGMLSLLYGASLVIALVYAYAFYRLPDAWRWAARSGYAYGWLAAVVFLVLVRVRLKETTSALEQSRLRVIGAGAIFGFFLPTSGAVLAHVAGGTLPHNLVLVPAVFFPLCVAYALLQYNLFDMDNVLKIGLTRIAHTGVLLAFYVLILFFLNAAITVDERSLLVPLLFSILVVVVFNPVLRWVEGIVDRYFYRKEYDRTGLQTRVSLLLRTLSQPEKAAENYLRTISEGMGIEKSCCFFDPGGGRAPLGVAWTDGTLQSRPFRIEWSSRALRYLEIRRSGIARDEVDGDPGHRDYRAELLRLFEELGAALLLPVVFEDHLLGVVALGSKRSGTGYTADDFVLLSGLTDQLALALKNGVLFEESEKTKENYEILYIQSEAANRRLLEMDRLKKQFVSNISHELRTPISTILGYTEVLLERPFQGDERIILERVVSSSRDLTQMMDSLLDFARMESGGAGSGFQRIDLRDLILTIETAMQRLLKSRPIRFRVQLDPAVEMIETDGKKVHQILMQLLTNALKFTQEGRIELKVERLSERGLGWIRVCVSDTGIGIPEAHRETIFEEFRQLDGSSTRTYGGTGLGLSLCRKWAQSLGATIEVESMVGQGSTFSLVLPSRGPLPDPVFAPRTA